jgi:peptidoglycan/xylan/chitin deacetylase (PgdA/CDA1 family)
VRLTFDDSIQQSVLQILDDHNVQGIFFPTGNFARQYPHLIDAALDAGHLMGNHSSTHPRLTNIPDAQVLAEIDGGVRGTENPPLLRPPFGAYDQRIVDLAAQRGYRVCKWTVASGDRSGATTAQIIANARDLTSGGVFIMHPSAPNAADALPGVIAAIRNNNLILPSL